METGSSKKSISSSSFIHSKNDPSKSSTDSLSSADTILSILRKPSPSPPPVPERRRSVEEATKTFTDNMRKTKRTKSNSEQTAEQSTTAHRKSVSFDLSDNEYIPVFSSESNPTPSEPPENLADLYLSQFSRESDQEGDGYEVPIKYPSAPRPKRPTKVKSILRSPSPNQAATTILSSLDRPLRTTRISPPKQTVTSAIVHVHATKLSDDEIERENPFRKEFLEQRPYENIYEELRFEHKSEPQPGNVRYSSDSDSNEKEVLTNKSAKKVRPKSAYCVSESNTYSEILPKSAQSNENLLESSDNEKLLPTKIVSKSTGSLAVDRPKNKPPLPPKPLITKSPSPSPPQTSVSPSVPLVAQPTVKHADVLQNDALKIFQSEMLRGDFYEYRHDPNTNQITKVKQTTSSVPVAQQDREDVLKETPKDFSAVTRQKTFNPGSPLPPIPLSSHQPPYTKVYKRTFSSERPSVSPPPPPINLSTLPTPDKLHTIKNDDGTILEILSTKIDVLPKPHRSESHHENSPDYNLVTEATHREILLHENELRNAIQDEQTVTETTVTVSRIPIRQAPPPPPSLPPSATSTSRYPMEFVQQSAAGHFSHTHDQQQVAHTPVLASNQVFPQTQVLPVQYSQLPMPQQPGYFHACPPTQLNVCYPSGYNTISTPSGFTGYLVSDSNVLQQNVVSNMGLMGQYHYQQQHQPQLQQSCVSLPPFQSNSNQQQQQHLPNTHPQNYVNILNRTASSTSTLSPNSLNNNNTNWNYTTDAYPNNYNQKLLYQQHQQNRPNQQQQFVQYAQPHHHNTQDSQFQTVVISHNPVSTNTEQIINNRNTSIDISSFPITTINNENTIHCHDDSTVISSSIFSSLTSDASSTSFTSSIASETISSNIESGFAYIPIVVSSTSTSTSTSSSSAASQAALSPNYRNVSSPENENSQTFTSFGKQTSV